MQFRHIQPKDDARLAGIVRVSLERNHLDIPGTAYFDPELDHLSAYYLAEPDSRRYLVVEGEDGLAEAGVGIARLSWDPTCAEVQKLYLSDTMKGQGLGRRLMELIEREATEMGFASMYLETHSNLKTAIDLYRRMGYVEIEQPAGAIHTTMDHFFLKRLAN